MIVAGRTDEESIEVKTDRVLPLLASIVATDADDIVVVRLDSNSLRVLARLARAAADELDARAVAP